MEFQYLKGAIRGCTFTSKRRRAKPHFNTSRVRLEAAAVCTRSSSTSFQYLKGAIRGRESARLQLVRADFNTSRVRLEEEIVEAVVTYREDFNTSRVRLEDELDETRHG